MVVIYRGGGAWGTGKGSPLTAPEVDGNFWDLVSRVLTIETAGLPPDMIETITMNGSQLFITTTEGGAFGPFNMPVALFHWTGQFEADHDYSELEIIEYHPDSNLDPGGVYIVMQAHHSDEQFDPNREDGGEEVYHQLFETPPDDPRIELAFYHRGVVGDPAHHDTYDTVMGPEILFERVALNSFFLANTDVYGVTNIAHVCEVLPTNPTLLYINKFSNSGEPAEFVGVISISELGEPQIIIDESYGTDILFQRGTKLQITGPDTPDETWADFAITFLVYD